MKFPSLGLYPAAPKDDQEEGAAMEVLESRSFLEEILSVVTVRPDPQKDESSRPLIQ